MNTKILQKCIDSLSSPTPDISYIKGMLETLMELSGNSPVYSSTMSGVANVPNPSITPEEIQEDIDNGGSGIVALYNGNPGAVKL